jgi:spermidine synthase
MMAHVAMMQHRKPKRALVIGGGDGYVLSEVLKHDDLLLVDHVDLDEDVIEVCKEHFSWGYAWKDPRVVLHIEDGAAFVAHTSTGNYDVIIQDSSDPWTWDSKGRKIELPSAVLYSESHFQNIFRILGEGGIFIFQVSRHRIHHDDNSSSRKSDLPRYHV